MTDVEVARLFHDTYERLAPAFGYVTREETKEWQHDSPNGALMVEVVRHIRSVLLK